MENFVLVVDNKKYRKISINVKGVVHDFFANAETLELESKTDLLSFEDLEGMTSAEPIKILMLRD